MILCLAAAMIGYRPVMPLVYAPTERTYVLKAAHRLVKKYRVTTSSDTKLHYNVQATGVNETRDQYQSSSQNYIEDVYTTSHKKNGCFFMRKYGREETRALADGVHTVTPQKYSGKCVYFYSDGSKLTGRYRNGKPAGITEPLDDVTNTSAIARLIPIAEMKIGDSWSIQLPVNVMGATKKSMDALAYLADVIDRDGKQTAVVHISGITDFASSGLTGYVNIEINIDIRLDETDNIIEKAWMDIFLRGTVQQNGTAATVDILATNGTHSHIMAVKK